MRVLACIAATATLAVALVLPHTTPTAGAQPLLTAASPLVIASVPEVQFFEPATHAGALAGALAGDLVGSPLSPQRHVHGSNFHQHSIDYGPVPLSHKERHRLNYHVIRSHLGYRHHLQVRLVSIQEFCQSAARLGATCTDPGAYTITVQPHNDDYLVQVTAHAVTGVQYALETLRQHQHHYPLSRETQARSAVPLGRIIDAPAKPYRIVHIDAGRKYYSEEFFLRLLERMAALKLNQLQYHFSDNEGFRLESRRHPEIVNKAHLTQDQLKRIIQRAELLGIEVIPAFDVPGHMEAILEHHPEFRASETAEGRKILNYANPDARHFVFSLIDEYAALFPSRTWHMGGDEVFDFHSTAHSVGARFPQLLDYARHHAQAGPQATVLDGYVAYLGTVAQHLYQLGITEVRAWNDALYWEGTTETLDPRVVITYWSRWFPSWVSVKTIRDHGHRIINFNGNYLYYVLARPGGAYFVAPTSLRTYHWDPGIFPTQPGTTVFSSQEDQQRYPADAPWILGGAFSVWSDVPDAQSEQQVLIRSAHPMTGMAAKVWKTHPAAPWPVFYQRAQ